MYRVRQEDLPFQGSSHQEFEPARVTFLSSRPERSMASAALVRGRSSRLMYISAHISSRRT